MKIIPVPNPPVKSFTVCESATTLVEDIRRTRTINFDIHRETATTIGVSVDVPGRYSAGVCWPVEGFKFLERNHHNWMSGRQVVKYCFKRLKSQGRAELHAYLLALAERVCQHYGIDPEEVDELHVTQTPAYLAFAEKQETAKSPAQ